jgi:osmoprotectant transport system substrate-binding protein
VVKRFVLAVVLVLTVAAGASLACVGKTLYVGVTANQSEMLLAEMISVLVSERTGTTVKILQFKDVQALYKAVGKGEVGLLVENTERAAGVIGKGKDASGKAAYELMKSEYRKGMNLIWLEPVGGTSVTAPVISVETVSNLPALPKLINKLSNTFNEDMYSKIMKSASGNNKKTARDFLKSKKLI